MACSYCGIFTVLQKCVCRNVNQSSTTSPHVINGNPAYVGEEAFSVVRYVNVTGQKLSERRVAGVRDIRPVLTYTSDIDTPWATNNYCDVPQGSHSSNPGVANEYNALNEEPLCDNLPDCTEA